VSFVSDNLPKWLSNEYHHTAMCRYCEEMESNWPRYLASSNVSTLPALAQTRNVKPMPFGPRYESKRREIWWTRYCREPTDACLQGLCYKCGWIRLNTCVVEASDDTPTTWKEYQEKERTTKSGDTKMVKSRSGAEDVKIEGGLIQLPTA